jgi:hypothetical protein
MRPGGIGRLHTGELIAAGAAVVLLVVMFLGWYEPHRFQNLGVSTSAWQAYSVIDLILALTIAAAISLAVLTVTQQTAALPVTMAVIVTALGLLSTLLVLFRVLIDQPGMGVGVSDKAVDNTIWAWVGLLCCLAIFYGGYRTLRDESPRGPQGLAAA